MNIEELERKEDSDDANFHRRYPPLYIHQYSGDLIHSCKVKVGWLINEAGSTCLPKTIVCCTMHWSLQ
jgi:hypothetical protein